MYVPNLRVQEDGWMNGWNAVCTVYVLWRLERGWTPSVVIRSRDCERSAIYELHSMAATVKSDRDTGHALTLTRHKMKRCKIARTRGTISTKIEISKYKFFAFVLLGGAYGRYRVHLPDL